MLKRCSRGGVSIWAWGKRLRAMMCRGSVLSGRSLPRNLDLSTCALALHSWRTLVGPRADRPTAKTRSRPLAPRPPQEILPETQAGFTGNPEKFYRKFCFFKCLAQEAARGPRKDLPENRNKFTVEKLSQRTFPVASGGRRSRFWAGVFGRAFSTSAIAPGCEGFKLRLQRGI